MNVPGQHVLQRIITVIAEQKRKIQDAIPGGIEHRMLVEQPLFVLHEMEFLMALVTTSANRERDTIIGFIRRAITHLQTGENPKTGVAFNAEGKYDTVIEELGVLCDLLKKDTHRPPVVLNAQGTPAGATSLSDLS